MALMWIAIGWAIASSGPKGHECPFNHCPYAGAKGDPEDIATDYIGRDAMYTDVWCLDVEHLKHPSLSYDELEDILFVK